MYTARIVVRIHVLTFFSVSPDVYPISALFVEHVAALITHLIGN